MDTIDKIYSLKETIKTKIETALKNDNTETLIAYAKDLDLLERLEKQYNEIKTAVTSLDQRVKNNIKPHKNINKSYKQIGKEERIIFIKEAQEKGINLFEEKGPLYKDNLGGLIGIPYASERKPGRWFLGLPNKKYKNIVLICKNEFSQRTYFIFPHAFCAKYQDNLSTDKKEKQIKFNVLLKNGIYSLIVPESQPITINEYIDKYETIQS
jgi:hypothetical protein